MVVRFVAYIDESGDTGLQAVKPNDPQGAGEWLVLSCFLARERDDLKCPAWVKEILAMTFKIIGDTITFSGSTTINRNCSGTGVANMAVSGVPSTISAVQ